MNLELSGFLAVHLISISTLCNIVRILHVRILYSDQLAEQANHGGPDGARDGKHQIASGHHARQTLLGDANRSGMRRAAHTAFLRLRRLSGSHLFHLARSLFRFHPFILLLQVVRLVFFP